MKQVYDIVQLRTLRSRTLTAKLKLRFDAEHRQVPRGFDPLDFAAMILFNCKQHTNSCKGPPQHCQS
jgi:hypothetical protein